MLCALKKPRSERSLLSFPEQVRTPERTNEKEVSAEEPEETIAGKPAGAGLFPVC